MPGQLITGVVRDQSGQPLAEASIAFAAAPVPLPDVAILTGADGRFQVAVPAPGRYAIVCTLPDGRGETRTIDVTSESEVSVTFDVRIDNE